MRRILVFLTLSAALTATISSAGLARTQSGASASSARRADKLPASLIGKEWSALPTKRRVVALTFDGGSGSEGVPLILKTLQKTGVRGTFFLTGRFSELYPRSTRAISARYPIGNHSFDHPHLTALSNAAVWGEITHAQRVIKKISGQNPRPLFRFPYGDSNSRVIGIANGLGYGGIRWTIDTLGWEGTAQGQSTAKVLARVRSELRPGAIVLMHLGAAPDSSTLDAHALSRVIAVIRARGYGFATLDQFLAKKS